jgi:hypothetical protein
MMTTAQRARLKQSPELYRLTMAVDGNTRAVAKVVSAAEYVLVDDGDAHLLYICMEILIRERRELRRAMWAEMGRNAESANAQ